MLIAFYSKEMILFYLYFLLHILGLACDSCFDRKNAWRYRDAGEPVWIIFGWVRRG